MSEANEGGRPSRYTPELGLAICLRLFDGESLRAICRDPVMPSGSSVFRWLRAHPEFREQYVHAREAQAELLFDELIQIADDVSQDWVTGPDGQRRLNKNAIKAAKLRIDVRKWLIVRMLPKVYGRLGSRRQ